MPSGFPGSKRTYKCMWCQKDNFWGYSKTNKYCGNDCQRQHKWEYETKPRIERGECTHNSVTVLKRYLIEKFEEKCFECGILPIWNGKPLVLQLDHIDGDSDNNFPDNVRLICPNCHTQSVNFGSKGKGSRYKKITKRNSYLQEYKKL